LLLELNRDRHQIHQNELSRFLQRHFPSWRLFLYRHRDTRNFMIAVRANDRFASEVFCIGPDWRKFARDDIQELRRRLNTRPTRDALWRITGEYESFGDDARGEANERHNWLMHRPSQSGWRPRRR